MAHNFVQTHSICIDTTWHYLQALEVPPSNQVLHMGT
jgi:hypothetical protein